MSNYPFDRSGDDIAKELLKPLERILAEEDEKLKKVDALIQEAERKSKPVLDPER